MNYFAHNPEDGNTIPDYNLCPGMAGFGGANEYDPGMIEGSNQRLSRKLGLNTHRSRGRLV